ncbi:unnamed protein product [Victoria cruziana]
MKKYGLQLRAPAQQNKPLPSLFRDDDDDDVEKEIARQASKQKSLRDVKYVHSLMKTAKAREKVQDIVYERKLLRERSKEDHLYADKDKFVTSSYKKKLAEQAKWLEEERLREILEQKDDVTKKDITDFYFNLSKNVAFGARTTQPDRLPLGKPQEMDAGGNEVLHSGDETIFLPAVAAVQKEAKDETEKPFPSQRDESAGGRLLPDVSSASKAIKTEHDSVSGTVPYPHHKRSDDVLVAAKERYMARKRAKEQ